MNYSLMIGRLTTDAEIKKTSDDKAVARFTIAVQRSFKKEGEPDADFFKVVAFGKLAGRIEKLALKKGTKLAIESEVRNNNYTDKDGNKHYETQLYLQEFEFCEKKQDTDRKEQSRDDDFLPVSDDGGLPFK